MGCAHSFDDVLNRIRSDSKDVTELGKKFEVLTRDFLKEDRHYKNRFAQVVLWKDWDGRDGQDTGIDLVAVQRADEDLCAIQCKCYDEGGSLDTKAVSKFLAKASALDIPHKILVYTGDLITANARRLIEQSRCQIITSDHFRDSRVNWATFPKITSRKPKQLRPHQEAATSDAIAGLKNNDSGQLIMACGTGKTLASLYIAERQYKKGGIVLYLVPSISLILQSMREWSENANMQHYYLAVCSDKSTGEDGSITELEAPVSTNPDTLALYVGRRPAGALTVVFSTYHSLGVVRKAMDGAPFDLIFCDEAHRTTGAEDKSFFTDVHKNSKINGKKRLYMTATPRVYSDAILARTGKIVYSMDDEAKYGPVFHRLTFAEAVRQGILSDFRVKIAIVPADTVDEQFQQSIAGKGRAMPLDERTLLAAVWHGLNYPDDGKKPRLLHRVIAFANRIDRSMMFAGIVTDENGVDRSFKSVVAEYEKQNPTGHNVEVDHIDGKTRALSRRDRMRWLNGGAKDSKTCRILSNARCLAEGVDVPALDGIVFLNPRKSRVDVVQSVGRVMRKSENKKFGYVILPVAIPAGIKYHEALDDNRTFKVVWQVLNALRSHDEDFGHEINRLILDKNPESTGTPRVSVSVLDESVETEPLTKFFTSIKSKLVEKVGDINYYNKYGEKLGAAASTIESRIRTRIEKDQTARMEIDQLREGLKEMVGDVVTLDATVQVLAQHVVLARVFDQLFSGEFTTQNPIAKVFETVTAKIGLEEELHDLAGFYKAIDREIDGIKTRVARQNFIKKIYGNFFESTDKKGAERHGIVYTPVEVIDFIILSVDFLLQKNFGLNLNDRLVKVLDPFTGTGTFLTRLLESGLITDNMYKKYRHDMFANELILLAYYIATVNIETTYSSLRKGGKYVPFTGISYTDTLRINPLYLHGSEHKHEQSKIDVRFKVAHERIKTQRSSHVHVIIGNPPYSAGQSNYDDENQNIRYPDLDARIKATYLKRTKAQRKASLYDSYIRALRWASDRIGNSGIIAVITNAGFLRSDPGAGIRMSLEEEFNEIWCFDLRGNQRTQGDVSKREGGKIFGAGSRASVAITLLVKQSNKKGCKIYYHDIGDYLTRDEKLHILKSTKSIKGIKTWNTIKPDENYDWLDQRRSDFKRYKPLGLKRLNLKSSSSSIFKVHSGGVATSRDAWVYNSSVKQLERNMKRHINYCNSQDLDNPVIDSKRGKWGRGLSQKIKKRKPKYDPDKIRSASYRPFFKQYLYFDQTRMFNNEIYQIPKLFPNNETKNLTICIPYKFVGELSVLVTDTTPDLELVHHGQCFSLYRYDVEGKEDNITDRTLSEYRCHYKNKKITKKDIFYYIYGLLHHPGYKKKFASNLTRELPHVPMAPDFTGYRNAGKKLVDLHVGFETCTRYNLGSPNFIPKKFSKLSFGISKTKSTGKTVKDKTIVRVDGAVLFTNVPVTNYMVNGRTPLEWVIDRYKVTTDSDSGIVNDPCTGIDIVSIIERAVYIGLESARIIDALPAEFEPGSDWEPAEGDGLEKFINNNDSSISSRRSV